jgi:S-layer domain protein
MNKNLSTIALAVLSTISIAQAANNITGDNSNAFGDANTINGHNSVAVGYSNRALANETTVIGEGSIASGLNSGAFGSKASALGESALAIGTGANATKDSTVAIGNDSNATGKSSVAVGQSTNATGVFATALGDSSKALGNRTVAASVDSVARGDESIAIGAAANTDEGVRTIAIGAATSARGESSTVIGGQANGGIRAAVIGAEANGGVRTVAAGYQANATGLSSVAIGDGSVATHDNSLALGAGATSKVERQVTTATVNGITYSGFAATNPVATASFGADTKERQLVNVASGEISETSTDAINGSQLHAVANQVGTNKAGIETNAQNIVNNTNYIKKVEAKLPKVVAGTNTRVEQTTDANGAITYTISSTGSTDFQPAIDANKKAIEDNKASIDKNTNNIATNANNIATNTQSIKDLEAKLPEVEAGSNTTVETKVDATTGKKTYVVSATAGKDYQPEIDTNKANIAKNATAIQTNSDNINTNKDNIAKNTDYIKQVEAKLPEVVAGQHTTVEVTTDANGKNVYTVSSTDFQPAIDANKKAIETNAENIQTNKVGITTNADAIGVNKQNISNNSQAIAKNADNIQANAKGVAENKAKIVEVEAEAKRHSVVKGGKNISVNKTVGTNGESVYEVNANVDHLATKAEVNQQVANINKRIDGVNSKVNENTKRINKLGREIDKNRKRADAGTASVAAMANIPQVFLPGKSGVGVGVGHKHGQSAIAVGYTHASDNAKHITKFSVGYDSQKDTTLGAGYTYQW